MKSLLFPLGPGAHETVCAPSRSRICFPQSCGVSPITPRWPSKLNAQGAPPPPDARPGALQLGEPDLGPGTFTFVGEPL